MTYNKSWFDEHVKEGDMLDIVSTGTTRTIKFMKCERYNDYGLENDIVSFERQYGSPDEKYKHTELKWMKDAINTEEIRDVVSINGNPVVKAHHKKIKKGEKGERNEIRNELQETPTTTGSAQKGEKGAVSNTTDIVYCGCGGSYRNNANSKWYHNKSKTHLKWKQTN